MTLPAISSWMGYLALLAALVSTGFHLFNEYYYFIPGIVMHLKWPVYKNREVFWTPVLQRSPDVKEDAPNIILILADDLGWNDITFYGGGFHNGAVSTPNIDAIGHTGASFQTAYSGHATCSPSRAALLSGRVCTKIGYEFTPIGDGGAKAISQYKNGVHEGIYYSHYSHSIDYKDMVPPPDLITIPKILKQAGYRTVQLGKWHLGMENDTRPISQGFDETLESGIISFYLPPQHPDVINCYFDDVLLDKFLWANIRYEVQRNEDVTHFNPTGYYTDYIAKEAVKAIEANKNTPFFMYLAFTAPHSPFQALNTDYDKFSYIEDHCSRVYAAMLHSLDRAVGTVMDALKDNGIDDNTIVVFTADNGAPHYVHQADLNKPFRGWKGTLFEGGMHVPLFLKWPAKVKAGVRYDSTVVSHLDILPTLVAAATGEATYGPHHEIDGTSLLPLLLSSSNTAQNGDTDYADTDTDSDFDGNNEDGKQAFLSHVFTEKSKKRSLFWRSGHYMALRKGPWKIQMSERPKKVWLFNLDEDPTEQHNLAYDPKYMEELTHMMGLATVEDFNQSEPIWDRRSETPIAIDHDSRYQLSDADHDEYIYWAN